jgi:hypothetical protein
VAREPPERRKKAGARWLRRIRSRRVGETRRAAADSYGEEKKKHEDETVL